MKIDRALLSLSQNHCAGMQIEEHKRAAELAECKKTFQSVLSEDRLSQRQKHEALVKLVDRINLLEKTPERALLLNRVNRAVSSTLKAIKLTENALIELGRETEAEINISSFTLNKHLVLDSVNAAKKGNNVGFEGTTMAFLRDSLIEFQKSQEIENPGQIDFLKEVILAVEHALVSALIFWDYFEEKNKRLESHDLLLRDHLLQRFKEMMKGSADAPSFMFITIGSEFHAVVALVKYSRESNFSMSLVNTGDGSVNVNDESVRDLLYTGLSLSDLEFLVELSLNKPRGIGRFIFHLKRSLPAGIVNAGGRQHRVQRGDSSCSYKSLTCTLHDVMPEKLYRDFKVFYTRRLKEMVADPGLDDLNDQILLKRTLKSSYYTLEEKLKGIEAMKAAGEDATDRIIDLSLYLQEIKMGHLMDENKPLNWARKAQKELETHWKKISRRLENL